MPTKPYHAILIKNYSLEHQTKLSWRFRLYHHTKSGSTCDPYKFFLGKLVTRHVRACNTCPYHTSRPTKNHYNEKIIPQYKPTPYQGMCLIRKNNMLCRPPLQRDGFRANPFLNNLPALILLEPKQEKAQTVLKARCLLC